MTCQLSKTLKSCIGISLSLRAKSQPYRCVRSASESAGWPDRAHPTTHTPFQECRLGAFSAVQPLLKPIQHFIFNPSDSVRPTVYPLGECPGFFLLCNVLWRVQARPLQLLRNSTRSATLSVYGRFCPKPRPCPASGAKAG